MTRKHKADLHHCLAHSKSEIASLIASLDKLSFSFDR
ncbi:hypothetical protein CCACVL1_08491, partial [Corchorus capsularis]